MDLADGDSLRVHEYIEAEEIAAPATPATGYVRRFNKAGPLSGSRDCLLDDTGCEHELAVQLKQTYWIAQDLKAPSPCNVCWQSGAAPGSDGGAAAVLYRNNGSFSLPLSAGDPAPLTENCGVFGWTGTQGLYKVQAYVTCGAPARLFSGDGGSTACKSARLQVRLKVNRRDRFGALKLILSDTAATNQSVYVIQSSRTVTNIAGDDTWQDFSSGAIDIAGWTAPLRLSLTAHGTLENGYLGLCELSVEYFALELWAR